MPQAVLTALPFKPSSSLRGAESALYRASNVKVRGDGTGDQLFLEAYAGSENLNEPIPTVILNGTLAFSPSSKIITGTDATFQTDLHQGQELLCSNGEVLLVQEILTQTTFINGRLPLTTQTAATANILPELATLNTNRAAAIRVSVLHYDRGTILGVGQGTLYVNGEVLPGDSMTLGRRAQVALYDSATNTYDVQNIGFDEIPNVTNTDVTVVGSGGTKNQSLGYFSFKVAYYSDITSGYGNPTDTLLDGGLTGYLLTVPNSTFNFDFTADVSNRPAKATGYIIYGTTYAGSADISAINSINGAWYEVVRVPFTSLTAESIAFDYIDSEVGAFVSFDNDSPPDAEFFASLDRYPFLISTNGKGVDTTGREASTSPGPYVSPIKADNFDAYPNTFKVPTEKGENIIGVVAAAGRIFVLTANTLQAVTPTGLPSAPFTCRPFWQRGFANPYNLVFVDDTLYGFSGHTAFRSIATGDGGGEAHAFASDVEQQMASWGAGYVYLAHDPNNEEVCFVSSAVRKNDEGFWETDIYPFSLTKGFWQPVVTLTDPERDMIVSGVATVAGHFEFICGGRTGNTVIVVTGAGSIAVNGNYTARGTSSGKPYYNLETYPDNISQYSIYWDGVNWIITDITDSVYYAAESVATPDLVTTWIQDTGLAPVPTVTSAPEVIMDTWRYDTGAGQDVPWYVTWTLDDSGVEMIGKIIRKLRPRGKFTNAKIQIYGALPDSDVDVTDLETGNNPLFEADLDDSTVVKTYGILKTRVKDLSMWTVRLEGTANWDGLTEKDQVHEIALQIDVSGQER